MQEIPATKVDLYLFNLINGYAKKSRVLDFFAVFFATTAGFLFIGLLLAYAIVTVDWQIFFIPLAAGAAARLAINETVYFFYQRRRPLEVLPIQALIKKPRHPAFPSGHASFFFGVAFTLLLLNPLLAAVFLVVSGCVGLARIFCGVHWPSDIVAGIVAGAIPFLALSLAI